MLDVINNIILNAQPTTLIIVGVIVFGLLFMVPRALSKMGVRKIAGIELHSAEEDYALQYAVNDEISEIDVQLKEVLWEYTEDLLLDFSEKSELTCDAAVGHILGGIFGHLRNHIMLNHLVDKLAAEYEDRFIQKLTRNVRSSISDSKRAVYDGCPCKDEVGTISIDRYTPLIHKWIDDARIMVASACEEKIARYEDAVEKARSAYWKDVFKKCIEKNERYIAGMRIVERRRRARCED